MRTRVREQKKFSIAVGGVSCLLSLGLCLAKSRRRPQQVGGELSLLIRLKTSLHADL